MQRRRVDWYTVEVLEAARPIFLVTTSHGTHEAPPYSSTVHILKDFLAMIGYITIARLIPCCTRLKYAPQPLRSVLLDLLCAKRVVR